ncbi:MAG: hypothetical protein RJQ09_02345 [Cyclobacteriaceae bacterium]
MYESFLFIHSYLRWIILVLMLVVIAKSYMGWLGSKEYLKFDETSSKIFQNLIRLQFVIGLALYLFLSPLTEAAFADFGAAMKNADLRYWAVEHIFAMFVAIALIEIGGSKAKKASTAVSKFKFQAIFFTIALLIMLSRIPLDAERLFR